MKKIIVGTLTFVSLHAFAAGDCAKLSSEIHNAAMTRDNLMSCIQSTSDLITSSLQIPKSDLSDVNTFSDACYINEHGVNLWQLACIQRLQRLMDAEFNQGKRIKALEEMFKLSRKQLDDSIALTESGSTGQLLVTVRDNILKMFLYYNDHLDEKNKVFYKIRANTFTHPDYVSNFPPSTEVEYKIFVSVYDELLNQTKHAEFWQHEIRSLRLESLVLLKKI